MPSFHCITYGCQMNVNDSAWVARSLVLMGWQESTMEYADFVFINTCSVREKPQHKLLSMLGMIRDINPEASVAVAGCVAQQMGESLWEKNAHVHLVVGSDGIAMVPRAFTRIAQNPSLRLSFLNFTDKFPDRNSELLPFKNMENLPTGTSNTNTKSNDTRAFVNIIQGCDNYCAYCIVPYTRGPRKSRATSSIIHECEEWLERGTCDITVLGQNVNVFGEDSGGDGTSFVQLLYKIAKLDGIKRLHLMTSHPKDFSDGTIQAYKDLGVLAPRLHLPLQSGSDATLKSMGRGYTQSQYLKLVDKLKTARPNIALSSDIIVGFPGETEKDFEETLRIVKEVDFIASFSFCYSDRPGTRASAMTNKIPAEIQLERLKRLIAQQQEQEQTWLKTRENVETEVLLEAHSKKPKYSEITESPKDRPAEQIRQEQTKQEEIRQEEANANNFMQASSMQASSMQDTRNTEDFSINTPENTSWQGHDAWGNTINLLVPNHLEHKAGNIVPVRIIRAKRHSLLAELR